MAILPPKVFIIAKMLPLVETESNGYPTEATLHMLVSLRLLDLYFVMLYWSFP